MVKSHHDCAAVSFCVTWVGFIVINCTITYTWQEKCLTSFHAKYQVNNVPSMKTVNRTFNEYLKEYIYTIQPDRSHIFCTQQQKCWCDLKWKTTIIELTDMEYNIFL